jgi:NAD(P)-dependent dehydrogenase (short-subunit alcohol dehydrogenase family)
VTAACGTPLPIVADVAAFDEVVAAASRMEAEFGGLDVWVNVAFTSVFAPFSQISPDELRRVTEVSYLGFVYRTIAAPDRMRRQDRGVIVQVGSASANAASRSNAYCGAKHGINGFTSARDGRTARSRCRPSTSPRSPLGHSG